MNNSYNRMQHKRHSLWEFELLLCWFTRVCLIYLKQFDLNSTIKWELLGSTLLCICAFTSNYRFDQRHNTNKQQQFNKQSIQQFSIQIVLLEFKVWLSIGSFVYLIK